jgi:hypothetical protein
MRAVVDRIVEGLAILLVGDEEVEHHVPVERLPEGVGEGAWLNANVTDEGVEIVGVDEEGERQREQLQERIERLRKRGGRFGR